MHALLATPSLHMTSGEDLPHTRPSSPSGDAFGHRARPPTDGCSGPSASDAPCRHGRHSGTLPPSASMKVDHDGGQHRRRSAGTMQRIERSMEACRHGFSWILRHGCQDLLPAPSIGMEPSKIPLKSRVSASFFQELASRPCSSIHDAWFRAPSCSPPAPPRQTTGSHPASAPSGTCGRPT